MTAAAAPKRPLAGLPKPAHEAAQEATVYIRTLTGAGAGIAWDSDTIVTAAHVVVPLGPLLIATRNGTACQAQSVRVSLDDDIAFIDVSGCRLHPLQHAKAASGDRVWTAGHPLGNRWSISRGIVMALRKQRLQIDASVNPGNSGGPVVDEQGRLIGMVTGIASVDGLFAGIGWAIPVAELEKAENGA